MIFQTGAALLDAIVLAVVSKEEEGTYGYKITQEVRSTIEVSESTLYPVLRRLQKNRCLEVYDVECAGGEPAVLQDYGCRKSTAFIISRGMGRLFF